MNSLESPNWEDWQWVIFILPFLLGTVSGFLSPMKAAGKRIKARPPGYVFGIVWTLLFLLYGAAWNLTISYWANDPVIPDGWLTGEIGYILSMVLYSINMACLFAWPFVYNHTGPWSAMFLLLGSLVLTLASAMISPPSAGVCLSPLLGWEIFALFLNFTIVNSK